MSKSKRFKSTGDVQLINGGYLSDSDSNGVNNSPFVAAQQRAHLLITVAAAMKGKTFTAKTPDCIASIISECNTAINTVQATEYVKAPKEPTRKLQDQLTAEANKWMEHQEEVGANEALNDFLQEFNVIQEFEEFGLFFSAGTVKLDGLYTMKEIIAAAQTVQPVLAASGATL